MKLDKNRLIEHILKSDLTATEKRYLEYLVSVDAALSEETEERIRYLPECPCCGAKNEHYRAFCDVCGARMDNKHD